MFDEMGLLMRWTWQDLGSLDFAMKQAFNAIDHSDKNENNSPQSFGQQADLTDADGLMFIEPPKDAGLSKDHFQALLQAARPTTEVTREDADAFFDLLDTDEDGVLEKQEMQHKNAKKPT